MKEERKGELYILAETALWSLFPIVSVLTFTSIPPLVSLAWTDGIAALFFLGMIAVKGAWAELRNARVWRYALFITAFIGVGYYGLFFLGLQYTTPGNAAILALCESLTTYILFNVIRKEKFPPEHIAGAVLMLIGAIIIVAKDFTGFAVGDVFILAATCFSPFGNLFQKKTREIVSSETAMFTRNTLSMLAVFGLAFAFGNNLALPATGSVWVFLLLNGVVITGISKLFFLEGIHRISVTKSILFHDVTPLLTLLFAWLVLSQAPTVWQLASIVPFFAGALLLTGNLKRPAPLVQ